MGSDTIDPFALKSEGNSLFHSGDVVGAKHLYLNALKLSSSLTSDHTEALCNNLAQCCLKLQEWQDCINYATQALNVNPFNEKALYRRAYAYEKSGEIDKSYEDATRLLKSGNKEAANLIATIRTQFHRQHSKKIDDSLPSTLLATAKAIIAFLDNNETSLISHGQITECEKALDTLRAWVLQRNHKRLFLENWTMITLIKLLSSSSSLNRKANAKPFPQASNKLSSDSTPKKDVSSCPTNASSADESSNGLCEPTACDYDAFEWNSVLLSMKNVGLLRLQLATWRLLAALVTNHTSLEDDSSTVALSKMTQSLEKPIEIDSVTKKLRGRFSELLSYGALFGLFKCYVRAGLGSLDESLESTLDLTQNQTGAVRSRCVALMTECLSACGNLDEPYCLECLNIGIGAVECLGVVRSSLQALARLADCRRRYGSKVKALKKCQALIKALENTLQLLSHGDDQVKNDAEFCLVSIFRLLADKDRAPADEVSIEDLANLLLGPYIVEGRDPVDSFIGLRGILLLWMADRDSVKAILTKKESIGTLVNLTCSFNSECPPLQRAAAEVLMHAMEFADLRLQMLDVDGVNLLGDLCACRLKHRRDADLKIKVAATLARLCIHDESVRLEIFDKFDFFTVAFESLNQFKVMRPIDDNAGSVAGREFGQTLRNFLEVMFFLSIHGSFKNSFLKLFSDQSEATLLVTLDEIAKFIIRTKDGMSVCYYANVFCNLLRSREDKERVRRPRKSGPQLDDEQAEALKEFFDKLPEHAKPSQNGKFDRGSVEVAESLANLFIKQKVVQHLSKMCLIKPSLTPNVIASASESISLFARHQAHRGVVFKEGGVSALLNSITILQASGNVFEDDLARCKQSLAHICISVNPNLLSYREALDIIPSLLSLLDHSYELYQYEASLALTNATSISEEARDRAFRGKAWESLVNVATGENDLCRAGGLEGMCNMAMCQLLRDAIAEGRYKVDLQILLAFLGESENERAQEAAAGCLAMLTADQRIALRLCEISNVTNISKTLCREDEMEKKPGLLLRVITVINNIASAVSIEGLILVKEAQNNTDEPMTMEVTEEIKKVYIDMKKTLEHVNKSHYPAEVKDIVFQLLDHF